MPRDYCCDCNPINATANVRNVSPERCGNVPCDCERCPVKDTPNTTPKKEVRENLTLADVCSCGSKETEPNKLSPPIIQTRAQLDDSCSCDSSPTKLPTNSSSCSCSSSSAPKVTAVVGLSASCSCESPTKIAVNRSSLECRTGSIEKKISAVGSTSGECNCALTSSSGMALPKIPRCANSSSSNFKPVATSTSFPCSCKSTHSKVIKTTDLQVSQRINAEPETQKSRTCVQQSQQTVPAADYSSISVSSDDVAYFDTIKKLNEEEKHLKYELEELRHKEEAFSRTLKLFNDMHPAAEDEESDGQGELRQLNLQLTEKNKRLSGELEDLQLELRQLKERVEGPLKRQLLRERRKCDDLEHQLRSAEPDQTDLKQRQMLFLKDQICTTNRTIRDLNDVNRGMKEEVCVMNNKCEQMQQLIIQQKKSEINAINKLS